MVAAPCGAGRPKKFKQAFEKAIRRFYPRGRKCAIGLINSIIQSMDERGELLAGASFVFL
jgi:hypothetical protein